MSPPNHDDLTEDEMYHGRQIVRNCKDPEKLFGPDRRNTNYAKYWYRVYSKICHPDAGGSTELFQKLNALWDEWNGVKPPAKAKTITTRRRVYALGDKLVSGDIANLYKSTIAGKDHELDVVIKIPRNPKDNDLITAEFTALKLLREKGWDHYHPFVPRPVESFRLQDTGTGIKRQCNVLKHQRGFYDLATISDAYPDGLDPRDSAWMFRRVLAVLGYAHDVGVCHGAVNPDHLMIQPTSHGLVLVDWCYSSIDGAPIKAIVSKYKEWYPEEVMAKKKPGPQTDIHMAGKVLEFLCKNRAPKQFKAFIAGCTGKVRPDSAWETLEHFDQLIERLWGPKKFRPFTFPLKQGAV